MIQRVGGMEVTYALWKVMAGDGDAIWGGDEASQRHGEDGGHAVVFFHAVAEIWKSGFEVGDGIGRFVGAEGGEIGSDLGGAFIKACWVVQEVPEQECCGRHCGVCSCDAGEGVRMQYAGSGEGTLT